MPQDDSTIANTILAAENLQTDEREPKGLGLAKRNGVCTYRRTTTSRFSSQKLVVRRGTFQYHPTGSLFSSRSNASRRLITNVDVPEQNLLLSWHSTNFLPKGQMLEFCCGRKDYVWKWCHWTSNEGSNIEHLPPHINQGSPKWDFTVSQISPKPRHVMLVELIGRCRHFQNILAIHILRDLQRFKLPNSDPEAN